MGITLYIAATLDMYIASVDGSMDFMNWVETPEGEDYGFQQFYDSVDIVVMGRKTYENSWIVGQGKYPYATKKSYIFTEQDELIHDQEHDIDLMNDFHLFENEVEGKSVWLVGGGELVKEFLNHGLIDHLILLQFPIILGDGIPLFPKGTPVIKLQLDECKMFPSSLVQLTYHLDK